MPSVGFCLAFGLSEAWVVGPLCFLGLQEQADSEADEE